MSRDPLGRPSPRSAAYRSPLVLETALLYQVEGISSTTVSGHIHQTAPRTRRPAPPPTWCATLDMAFAFGESRGCTGVARVDSQRVGEGRHRAALVVPLAASTTTPSVATPSTPPTPTTTVVPVRPGHAVFSSSTYPWKTLISRIAPRHGRAAPRNTRLFHRPQPRFDNPVPTTWPKLNAASGVALKQPIYLEIPRVVHRKSPNPSRRAAGDHRGPRVPPRRFKLGKYVGRDDL